MRSARRWLGRVGLLGAGLAVAGLLAELGLRAWGGWGPEFLLAETPSLYDTTLFQPDPDAQVTLRPGATARIHTAEYDQRIRVNRLGLRGPELPPRAAGERRILAIGDSFTLGLQVTEAELFHARLAEALGAATGVPVTAWNAGVDNHGTPHALARARSLAPAIGADLVLLTFFTGNDLVDNLEYRQGTPVEPRPAPADLVSRLSRVSVLFVYGRLLWSAREVDRPGPGARHHFELGAFADPAVLTRQVGRTRAALQELGRTCAALGVPCVVAVAPPAFVPYPARVPATFRLYGHDPAAVDLDAPAEAVLAALPPGVRGVDLSPALRAAAAGAPLYFTLDGHWTAAGHRVVADALVEPVGAALGAR